MAKQTITRITDDLDGSPDARTVRFGLDGVLYEIDLSDVNEKQLRTIMEPFVQAGRRAGGQDLERRNQAGTLVFAARRERNAAIRAWARDSGHELAARGRIPAEVIEAYERAA